MEKGLKSAQENRSLKGLMALVYQNTQEKLKKYYKLTNYLYRIYRATILLYPSYRKYYFNYYQTREEVEWKKVMITNVKEIQEKEYKHLSTKVIVEPKRPPTIMEEFLQRTEAPPSDNEFDSYINGDRVAFLDADLVIPWFLSANILKGIKQ